MELIIRWSSDITFINFILFIAKNKLVDVSPEQEADQFEFGQYVAYFLSQAY